MRRRLQGLLQILAASTTMSCAVSAPAPEPGLGQAEPVVDKEIPTIRAYAELDRYDGEEVRLVGTYALVDVRMRPIPPAQYAGHAAVQLEGGQVFIEPTWSEAAIRPDVEQALAGSPVRVGGRLHMKMPQPPEPIAMVSVPCVSQAEIIPVEQ